jgi:hypothetical protein
MQRISAYILALVMILVVGYAHGVWTGRWSTSRKLEEAVAQIDRVPMKVDSWQGEPLKLEDEAMVLQAAHIQGYLYRKNVNAKTGDAVSMLLVCGRPGPIAVHTPDICFTGSGQELTKAPVKVTETFDGMASPSEFFLGDFAKPTSTDVIQTRVYWSWNGGEGWRAPGNPRLQFARRPYLYKLYVTSSTLGEIQPDARDLSLEFVRVMLPQLQRALTPGENHGGGGEPLRDRAA